jgi:hypothetical protein
VARIKDYIGTIEITGLRGELYAKLSTTPFLNTSTVVNDKFL